jgi:hypothetical protein
MKYPGNGNCRCPSFVDTGNNSGNITQHNTADTLFQYVLLSGLVPTAAAISNSTALPEVIGCQLPSGNFATVVRLIAPRMLHCVIHARKVEKCRRQKEVQILQKNIKKREILPIFHIPMTVS